MKFKLIFIAITIAILIIGYFSYPIVKSRYFPAKDVSSEEESARNIESKDMTGTTAIPTENNTGIVNSSSESDLLEETPSRTVKINISSEDCDSECSDFSIESELEYCKEVCGLSTEPKAETNGCENMDGIKKDYCLKDLAIEKKDFKICDQISDANLKNTCKNRLTEDILNGSLDQEL